MWRIKPRNSTTSMMRISGFFAMNSAPALNVTPPSLKKMKEFRVTCTIRKLIRKRPVRAIQYFLTREEPKSPLRAMRVDCHRIVTGMVRQKYGPVEKGGGSPPSEGYLEWF